MKPKNKDHANFYECCNLTEKVYLMSTLRNNYELFDPQKVHHGGPGSGTSGSESASNAFIPDETLQHLTVKELNKRVSKVQRFFPFLVFKNNL